MGHHDSLAFAKERRPLYSIPKQIKMLVSTNLSYRSVKEQAVIHLFYPNLYYIQRWKEGTPRVKLQLNTKFILSTLPSGLFYL